MEILCLLNYSLREEIITFKGEKENPEIMVQEKDDALKATKKELDDAKVVLKKFGSQNEKLDEILASKRFEPGHKGLGYINKALHLIPYKQLGVI
ncbi:hypothetical protein GOBAR_DD01315 [Gossypium barbadense]|nr:hypothetical protein GOBAR_DD01315 [Gossypium barbadense]